MIKKLLYILGILLIAPTLVGVAYAATPVSTVPTGGTGWGEFVIGTIPIGTGSSLPGSLRFATSTGFTFATSTATLRATYASTTAINAATICLDSDTCRTTWPSSTGSAFEVATTSDIAVPQLAYFTKTAGVTTLGSVATGTITYPTGLTGTAGRFVVGGNLTIGLDTGYVIPLQSTLDAKALGATTLTIAGTANQITSSAGAQDLSANRTWTLSLPNHVIFPSSYQAALGSTTNATSTNLTVTGNFIVEPLTSALVLTGTGGAFAEYAGTSCTNQFVRSLSALGAATCATVANTDLANSSVSYGGVTVALGASDATPAFDLTDATSLPIVAGTSGTLTIARGGTGTTTAPSGWLLYGGGAGVYQAVATSSLAVGTGLTSSGTLGSQVGGTASSISFAAINAGTAWANGTNASAVPTAIATSTWFGTGTGGQYLTWSNGVAKWTATSTYSCTSVTCSFANNTVTLSIADNGLALTKLAQVAANTILGNNTGATANVTALATTTGLFGAGTAGQVLMYTGTSNGWKAFSTTTFSGSAPITTSMAGNALTIACATCLTANQTITLSGVVTGTGATSITTAFGSQTAGVLGAVATANTSVLATSTIMGGTATFGVGKVGISSTTPAFTLSVNTAGSEFYIDSTGKVVARDTTNSWIGRLSPTRSFILGSGTTTTWTASTTGSAYSPYLVMPFAGTLRQMRCVTDAVGLGVNIQVNGSNATPSYVVGSTTVGTIVFSAGNTFSAGQKILANFGTTTTSTAKSINCTLEVTET